MDKSKITVTTALLAAAAFIIFLFVGFSIGSGGSPLLVVLALASVGALIYFFVSGNKKEVVLDDAALADARRMQAPSGMARLYIVRQGFVGGQQGMDVAIGETYRGQIKSGRALVADLPPGPHALSVRMARGGDKSNASLALDLAADSVTVVKATSSMGTTTAALQLSVMTDMSAARADLDKARFLAWHS
ncbi:hypothetical protein [Pelagerythrobacter aerophilus]|uniref:DUF2846 domain-containing protein n=1 Tax=Pelagerythrobacter aerophilus TaxID=2306995 RepID=A0A418NFY7_9SPHN|nr:hypothetical protein [Pelagerythrobacter aerophilus]RIV76847.1 hypothetical protein D2V04_11930 [Pelagerythrobacter aerophilus]